METIDGCGQRAHDSDSDNKATVMRMCNRIVVVQNGAIAEQGTYDELMEKKGVFAQLASGGEWAGTSAPQRVASSLFLSFFYFILFHSSHGLLPSILLFDFVLLRHLTFARIPPTTPIGAHHSVI